MLRYTIPLLAGTLALAACDSTPEADGTAADTGAMAESTATTMDSGTVAAPAATETVMATPRAATTTDTNEGTTTITTGPDGTRVEVDGRAVDATVGTSGATATVTPDR